MIFVDDLATHGKVSRAVLKTRLATMGALDRKREIDAEGAVDIPGTPSGKRNRAEVDAVENSEELIGNQEKRRRVGDLHLAIALKKEVATSMP